MVPRGIEDVRNERAQQINRKTGGEVMVEGDLDI